MESEMRSRVAVNLGASRRFVRSGLLVGAALLMQGLATAQERPRLGAPPGAGGGGDSRAELQELFAKVEKRLNRMSDLLGAASAGDTRVLSELGGAGIDELIRGAESPPPAGAAAGLGTLVEATRGHGKVLLEEIDRVLEIAREQNESGSPSSGSGQSQGAPKPGGKDPQQGQTPENSQQMQGQSAPKPGEKEQGDKPEKDGQTPSSNGENPPETPEQRAGTPPVAGEIGAPSGEGEGGQWGDLPVHVRKVFRNGVSEDVPPQYRDWIDAYHRKLKSRAPR